LQVPPSFFFEGLPAGSKETDGGFADTSRPISANDFVLTAEGVQLNKAFAKIVNPKVRRRIVDLVIAMANAGDSGNKSE